MKSLFIAALVASALTLAGAAMAQDKSEAPAAPAGASTPVIVVAPAKTVSPEEAKRLARANEVICYNDFDVGSHVRHTRVCLTRAQREEMQHDTAEAMDNLTSSVHSPRTLVGATPK